MASYDLDTFRQFVFESTFLERFDVDEKTVESFRSDEKDLFTFGMEWLQFALFNEGTIRPKVNKWAILLASLELKNLKAWLF